VPDKPIGREKLSRVHLWIVPARVDGAWCGTSKFKGTRLQLDQAFQKFSGVLADASGERQFTGSITGEILRAPPGLTMTFDGTRLKATYTTGKYSALRGATFARQRGQSCK